MEDARRPTRYVLPSWQSEWRRSAVVHCAAVRRYQALGRRSYDPNMGARCPTRDGAVTRMKGSHLSPFPAPTASEQFSDAQGTWGETVDMRAHVTDPLARSIGSRSQHLPAILSGSTPDHHGLGMHCIEDAADARCAAAEGSTYAERIVCSQVQADRVSRVLDPDDVMLARPGHGCQQGPVGRS